jgi:hypothetical protein
MAAPNRLRRAVAIGFTVLGVVAGFATLARAADFYADLDRDGVRDVISTQPSPGLLVWLSGSKVLLKLPTRRPILRVTARDLDGDGHVEIVATDSASKLHVWHRTRAGKLRPTRPRRAPVLPGFTDNHHVGEGPSDSSTAAIDEGFQTPPAHAPHPALVAGLDPSGAVVRSVGRGDASLIQAPHQPRAPPLA